MQGVSTIVAELISQVKNEGNSPDFVLIGSTTHITSLPPISQVFTSSTDHAIELLEGIVAAQKSNRI